MENSMEVPHKTKKKKKALSYDSATSLLGIYLSKTKIQKDPCTPMSTAA